ncbi:MAG: iron-sulfur cluster insertion protein ErpA [Acidimicrobiales bacterium]
MPTLGYQEAPRDLPSPTPTKKVKELIDAEGVDEPNPAGRGAPRRLLGLRLQMFFDTDIADDSLGTMFGEVKMIVDQRRQLLTGATSSLDGLSQAGFSINNPNASRTLCGCGAIAS